MSRGLRKTIQPRKRKTPTNKKEETMPSSLVAAHGTPEDVMSSLDLLTMINIVREDFDEKPVRNTTFLLKLGANWKVNYRLHKKRNRPVEAPLSVITY